MFSSVPSAIRRRGVLIASGTAVLLAVGGGTTAAFATSSPAPSSSATAPCAPRLGALLRGAVPGALKADLKELRTEKKGDRADDRKAIRRKALTGAYGERAERLAHLVAGGKGKGATWASALPAALRADLKALRSSAPKSAERKAAAAEIARKALAGTYGTTVQTRARSVQTRVAKRCAAQG